MKYIKQNQGGQQHVFIKILPNYLAHWQIMFIFAASKDE